MPSLRALESKSTRVLIAARTSDLLNVRRYVAVQEPGWGESTRIGDVSISTFEVNCWGARMRSDTYRGCNGYLIETPRHRVIFGGDTAATPVFRTLRSSRATQLAIGAYNPWIRATGSPVRVTQELSAYREGASLSADGRRVAYSVVESSSMNAWVRDIMTGGETRFAPSSLVERYALISPAGDRVAYSSYEGDTRTLCRNGKCFRKAL